MMNFVCFIWLVYELTQTVQVMEVLPLLMRCGVPSSLDALALQSPT